MAYFKDTVEKSEECCEELDQVCAECDFLCVEDICNGFCPECERMLRCDIYEEIKGEWEWFYT